jgi:hypothetical protein
MASQCFRIDLDIACGEFIHHACRRAFDIARERTCAVRFTFNDVEVVVWPDDASADVAYDRWRYVRDFMERASAVK